MSCSCDHVASMHRTQFRLQRGHSSLHRSPAHKAPPGDVVVTHTLGHQGKYLPLSRSQQVRTPRRSLGNLDQCADRAGSIGISAFMAASSARISRSGSAPLTM